MLIPAPLSQNDLNAYAALRDGAVCFHRGGLHHLEFSGAKAADALTGLVTNHVLALGVGSGQYAAALTAKGRIVADLRILRIGDEQFLTSTGDAAWPGWRDLVRKFVNPRLAKYTERQVDTLAVHGPQAHRVVQEALASLGAASSTTSATATATTSETVTVTATAAAMYTCTRIAVAEHELFGVESPELGNVPGVELLVPPVLVTPLLTALEHAGSLIRGADQMPEAHDSDVERTHDSAVERTHDSAIERTHVERVGSDTVWEVARLEAGRPAWGRDMDETTIPQEANLGDLHALSFDKGCYTGQETVARIHFRGHVNRHLRVLSSDIPLPVPSELRAPDGKVIGEVRSSVISPSQGPLAMAMVRREFSPGDRVLVFAKGNDERDVVGNAERIADRIAQGVELAAAEITSISGPPRAESPTQPG